MTFKTYILKDLVTIKYGKNQKNVISDSGSIPIYGTGGLIGYATEALYTKPSVLIGRKGTIEKIRYVNHPFWTVDTLFYTIVNENIVIPQFLYYALLQIDLLQYNEGTTIPSLRTETLNRIEIRIPNLENQYRILKYLALIDDKIALNTAINKNLEQQAQAIFKSWFVNFEPFGGVMPEDWNFKPISELDVLVTDYVANGSFKSLAQNVEYQSKETSNVLIRLTDFNNNYSSDMVYISDLAYEFLAKSKLFGDEIIISNVGINVGTVFRCPRLKKRMSLAPNAIMLRSEILEHYLYLYFTSQYGQQQLQSIVTGSAQPKFNKTNFRSLNVLKPPNVVLEHFNSVYSPMYNQIITNFIENQHLAALRDTLLPKFMNGEIDVSEVNM